MQDAHVDLTGEPDHGSVAESIFDWLQPFGRGPTNGKGGKQENRCELGMAFLVFQAFGNMQMKNKKSHTQFATVLGTLAALPIGGAAAKGSSQLNTRSATEP